MKRPRLLFLFLVVLILIQTNLLAQITFPSVGDTLQAGTVNFVKSVPGSEGPVFLSTDNGLTWQAYSGINNYDGTIKWLVPDVRSDSCLIRVGIGYPDFNYFLISELFSIQGRVKWEKRNVYPSGFVVHDIYFKNACTGWIVGANGIVKTIDYGDTWSLPELPGNFFNDIFFLNDNVGWLAGHNGALFKTTDGGESWSKQSFDSNFELRQIYFANEDIGYLNVRGPSGNALLKSTNGGQTWLETQKINSTTYKFSFVNKDIGWITGWGIHKTTDGGATFVEQYPRESIFFDLLSIQFVDENNGWVGGHGLILGTSDGGNSWIKQYSGDPWYAQNNQPLGRDRYLLAIHFFDKNNGYAVGEYGLILKTTDSGKNWGQQGIDNTFDMRAVFSQFAVDGWIGGDIGLVFQYNNNMTFEVPGMPYMTVWAANSNEQQDNSSLSFYSLAEGQQFKNVEGDITGYTGKKNIVDLTIDIGGNFYFLNNSWTSMLYKINPDQLDLDASTPVKAKQVGRTRLADETLIQLSDIHFIRDKLYGLNKDNNMLYEVSIFDAVAREIAELSTLDSKASGFTLAADGNVYLFKNVNENISEVWKFDNFPAGNLSLVNEVTSLNKLESFTSHPNGNLYASDLKNLYEINLTDKTVGILKDYEVEAKGIDFNFFAEKNTEAVSTLKFELLQGITSVEQFSVLPTEYSLKQNYPNPFNPSTTINFSLPEAAFVKLNVYNSLGEIVRTHINENLDAGTYETQFDASGLPSGIYIYKLEAGSYISSQKMILMK